MTYNTVLSSVRGKIYIAFHCLASVFSNMKKMCIKTGLVFFAAVNNMCCYGVDTIHGYLYALRVHYSVIKTKRR
jgi:hypothetical protein